MDKLKLETKNLAQEKFKKLAELFPNAITETIVGQDKEGNDIIDRAIDADVLRQEIADYVIEGREERYEFTWPDKRKSMLLANAPINKTLRPIRKDSFKFDETENLYIEGDNLDALKLLRETYLGKVKMIYIDPPYNTGNDFVYEDDFAQNMEDYKEISGDYDEEGNRLFKNTDSNGRFHTDWLNMMYPRLRLARDLLSDDGIIFISIDDNEVENLKKVCNEIFGERNFIAQFVWVKKKKGSHLSKTIRSMTEYILCYSKNNVGVELYGEDAYSDKQQPLAKRTNAVKQLIFPGGVVKTTLQDGNYKAGIYGKGTSALTYKKDIIVANGVVISEIIVEGPFIWTQNKLDEELKKGTIANLSNRFGFNVLRSDQAQKIKRPSTLIDNKINVGTNEDAYSEGIELFGKEGIISYPKPVSLIKFITNSITYFDKNSIILDYFSGSATTAHAVMELNAEDGGNRKYIMVQLPEETDEKSEAYKAGYKNICEIGKERIRRAGKKIREENPESNFDDGFRVLRVDSSNMKDVYHNPQAYEQSFLDQFESNIKEDRSEEDLLFQVMLSLGIELSCNIQVDKINGNKVLIVDDGFLIASFDQEISEDTIEEIAKKSPYYAVFSQGKMSDSSLANFEQIFETYSPSTRRKVI